MADQSGKSGSTLKLIIVESPSKIKTISKFLDKSFKVVSTMGHIMDLPERKLGVTIDEKTGAISLDYVPLDGKADVIADICKQAAKCDEVYLASDPDREGEIISWHIGSEIAKATRKKGAIHRITFNEITKTAIIEAIQNKRDIDMHRVNAQQARRVLDRWVGYEISPLLWRKITKGLSAGRVQSVAVLLVCNREEEIRNFKPEESWSIHGDFAVGKETLPTELYKIKQKAFKLKSEAEALKVIDAVSKLDFKISSITEKDRLKNPLPPFMTSTLQQDAYNKLGFSVDKTMTLAQKLYEGVPLADKNSPEALITYMRTDSLRIADSAMDDAKKFVVGQYGKEFYPSKPNIYAKSGAQDAHEAIRPISVTMSPEKVGLYAEPDIAKLYKLIWQRFVSSQMAPAKYFQRQVLVDGGDYTFKATGSTLVFEGCLKVYVNEDEEDEATVKIPKAVAIDLNVPLAKTDKKQHFTQPPPRYTEATLVKEMEKRGIGRPSTYVATLLTIQKRGYIKKVNKRFNPTELGETVNKFLVQNLADIFNVSFTAQMEEDLDKIAQGDVKRDDVLQLFYKKLKDDLAALGETLVGKATVITDVPCPDCGRPLAIRFGKGRQFLGCTGFPDCTFTSSFSRDEEGKIQLIEAPKLPEINEQCPECNEQLVARMGRFGQFVSCSGYPKCKYIKQEKLQYPCPVCGGDIVKKTWKKGSFWGCNNYPKCKTAFFGEILHEKCPKCKAPFLVDNGPKGTSCSNPSCDYKKES